MYGGEDFAADVARSLAEVERAFEAASRSACACGAGVPVGVRTSVSSLIRRTEHCVSLPGAALR